MMHQLIATGRCLRGYRATQRSHPISVAILLLLGFLCVAGQSVPALAQHPIDIQRKVAQEEFFEALKLYEQMPKRKATLDAVVAAAKAAWALSLPDRAIAEFDQALRAEQLTDHQRAQLLISRGIIEYQEGRFQVAVLYAEKAASVMPNPSPLRARAWLLWGESLYELKSYGASEHKLIKALAEVTIDENPDVHFLLGRTQIKLGKLHEAQSHLQQVPLQHERTAEAIRLLSLVALEEQNYEQARFWLERGREAYPDSFLDSWVDYALVQVAVHEKNLEQIRSLRADAQQKYPPSDHWLTLLNASAEAYEWETRTAAVTEN